MNFSLTTAMAYLKSSSPYSQSKAHFEPRLDGENHEEYEARTWWNRAHFNSDGGVFIPPTQFSHSIMESARYLSIQIPSKGKSTYTKHFETGFSVLNGITIPYSLGDLKVRGKFRETLFVPADGKPGGSRRVVKSFPTFPSWEGKVEFHILDNVITREVFHTVLVNSGRLIGIGRFRRKNRGFYGCFEVSSLKWVEGARI